MLETPSIRRYSPLRGSENATGADNQQERLRSCIFATENPQRLYAELLSCD